MIGIVSINRSITPGQTASFQDLYSSVGNNTGNLLFVNAVWDLIDGFWLGSFFLSIATIVLTLLAPLNLFPNPTFLSRRPTDPLGFMKEEPVLELWLYGLNSIVTLLGVGAVLTVANASTCLLLIKLAPRPLPWLAAFLPFRSRPFCPYCMLTDFIIFQ